MIYGLLCLAALAGMWWFTKSRRQTKPPALQRQPNDFSWVLPGGIALKSGRGFTVRVMQGPDAQAILERAAGGRKEHSAAKLIVATLIPNATGAVEVRINGALVGEVVDDQPAALATELIKLAGGAACTCKAKIVGGWHRPAEVQTSGDRATRRADLAEAKASLKDVKQELRDLQADPNDPDAQAEIAELTEQQAELEAEITELSQAPQASTGSFGLRLSLSRPLKALKQKE